MVSLAQARRIKEKHSDRLVSRPGVWGVGVEQDADGTPVLVIHTDAGQRRGLADLPTELEGVPVRIVEDAPFRKQGNGPGGSG